MRNAFTSITEERLGHYVYGLLDPAFAWRSVHPRVYDAVGGSLVRSRVTRGRALQIRTSNRPESLVDALARAVEEPLSSPFVAEIIVVRSRPLAGWLALRLAEIRGVWANTQWLTAESLLPCLHERVLGTAADNDDDFAVSRAHFFSAEGGGRALAPSRLPSREPVFAMKEHKAEGSEVDAVAVVLPHGATRVLTRELIYTAVTRARVRVASMARPRRFAVH